MGGLVSAFAGKTFHDSVKYYRLAALGAAVIPALLLLLGFVLQKPPILAAAALGCATGVLTGAVGPRVYSTLGAELLRYGVSHQTSRQNVVPALLGATPAFAAAGFSILEMLIGDFPYLSTPLLFATVTHFFANACVQSLRVGHELERLFLELSRPISLTYGFGEHLFRLEPPGPGSTASEHVGPHLGP